MGRLTPLLALALVAGAAEAAPRRVASLNLCTDELALLLAAPGQLASVTFLGADPHETPLAARAAGLHRNTGRMESVAALAPDLVLTGGYASRYAGEMGRRLGTKVVDVPPPQSLDDLRRNVRAVAAALDRKVQGERLIAWMDRTLGAPPARLRSGALISGGGYTVEANGYAARIARYAGVVQRAYPADRIEMERLLADPPEVLVVTSYRAEQMSRYQAWLQHPALRRLAARTRIVHIDGRSWTCLGPLVAADVARLRAQLAS